MIKFPYQKVTSISDVGISPDRFVEYVKSELDSRLEDAVTAMTSSPNQGEGDE